MMTILRIKDFLFRLTSSEKALSNSLTHLNKSKSGKCLIYLVCLYIERNGIPFTYKLTRVNTRLVLMKAGITSAVISCGHLKKNKSYSDIRK